MKYQSIILSLLAVSTMGLSNAEDIDSATKDLLQACEAMEYDLRDVTDAISEGADVNAKIPGSGQTCLMVASLVGNTEIVRYLLENTDADKNIGENMGYIPVDGAAFQGQPDVMKLLLEAGMDGSYFHEDGFTPLHRACWGGEDGHVDTIRVLLEHGVDINIKAKGPGERKGQTCMEMQQYEPIKEFLEEWMSTKITNNSEL